MACVLSRKFFDIPAFDLHILVTGFRSLVIGFRCQVSVTWFKGSAFKGSEVNKQQKKGFVYQNIFAVLQLLNIQFPDLAGFTLGCNRLGRVGLYLPDT